MAEDSGRFGESELRDYLRILRRRKWIVIGVVILVVGIVLARSLSEAPVYRASAQVLIQPRITDNFFQDLATLSDPERVVNTEIEIVGSRPVKEAVDKKLGFSDHVSASGVGATDIILISASHRYPVKAAQLANAYAEAYIEFKRSQAVQDLATVSKQLQIESDRLQTEIDKLSSQLESEYLAIDNRLPANPDNPQREADRTEARTAVEARIRPRLDSLVGQQNALVQRTNELDVGQALKTGGAQLVTPGDVPSDPVSPTPRKDATVGLALGLLLGIALAFLFEYLDDSIKEQADVERASDGLPVLGLIPLVADWRDRSAATLVSISAPRSPTAEAYRSLRTSVHFLDLDEPVRSLQVTSPMSAEGKTTTLANLAVVLAGAGDRVVMVDCDLRRPRLHAFFGLDNKVGLTSVLLGDVPLSAALQSIPGNERLQLLATGPVPPNPSELLSSRRVAEVLSAIQAAGNFVVVDSPPVLPVTDASVLAASVDATLLVTSAGVTTRKQLHRAVEVLRQVDAELVGTVLNQIPSEEALSYDQYYLPPEKAARRARHAARREQPDSRPERAAVRR